MLFFPFTFPFFLEGSLLDEVLLFSEISGSSPHPPGSSGRPQIRIGIPSFLVDLSFPLRKIIVSPRPMRKLPPHRATIHVFFFGNILILDSPGTPFWE